MEGIKHQQMTICLTDASILKNLLSQKIMIVIV